MFCASGHMTDFAVHMFGCALMGMESNGNDADGISGQQDNTNQNPLFHTLGF
jgi:hypothetical protein